MLPHLLPAGIRIALVSALLVSLFTVAAAPAAAAVASLDLDPATAGV